MAKLKKVLVMALSFAMATTAFVGCGGKNSDSTGNGELPKGKQVTEEEWNAAIAATKAATNFTATMTSYTYSGTEETGTKVEEETGTMKVADGKSYETYRYTYTVDGRTATGEYQDYCANVDGVCHHWYAEDGGEWEYDGAYGTPEEHFTGYCFVEVIEDYSFSDFTYDTEMNAYKCEDEDADEFGLVYIGITDGKISFMIMYNSYTYEGDTYSDKATCTITYGNATVEEPANLPSAE